MSITLDENWEFLSRQHERFLEDPGYLHWLEMQKQQEEIKENPFTDIHPLNMN